MEVRGHSAGDVVRLVDGYPRLEDLGLIGDGSTAGLIGRDGSVWWLCVPRFDSLPLFAALLDVRRGGAWRLAPEEPFESRQWYQDGTGILVTEMRSSSGVVRITDALALDRGAELAEEVAAARGELLRIVDVLAGKVSLGLELAPRGGAHVEPVPGGLRLRVSRHPELDLRLGSSLELAATHGAYELSAGEQHAFLLKWSVGSLRDPMERPAKLLDATRSAWHRWMRDLNYDGPQEPLVRRSAITLKLLDHFQNGAFVGAPTSSLPEAIGGARNWDYRYAWIRDAAFSVYALRRIGLGAEAWSFLAWVLDAAEADGRPLVVYDLDARAPLPEVQDGELEGYRGSRPVRWGNAAAEQRQHDVFGEIVDCAYQWARWGGELAEPLWRRLEWLVEAAAQEWHEPDQGIWEVRTAGRPFTYSAALCQVALDRGARIAGGLGLAEESRRWRGEADRIKRAILTDAWDRERKALTGNLGGGALDASLLSLPLRRVLRSDDPRMVTTTRAVVEELGAGGGLLYRYVPDGSPDGLPGHEGAFLLCSFWLVDNLAGQGHVDEAGELFESLCARASPLGLLPEQIDPADGSFLGNFPQAFSHVGLIASAVSLARRMGTMAPEHTESRPRWRRSAGR